MVRIVLFFIFYLISTLKSIAQDPIFTHNYLTPEMLNPAFTGLFESNTVGVIHRSQWPNLEFQLDSEYAFFNTWNESSNSGIGINFISQKQNFSKYRFTQFNFNYAYKVQLNEDLTFHPAIQIGWGTRSFNLSNFNFEDQIDIQRGIVTPFSVEFYSLNDKINFFDFSVGMLLNTENLYIGISLKHLNKPNVTSFSNGIAPLNMFFSLNFGSQFTISDYVNISQFPFDTKLKLTSNFIKQGDYKRIDLAAAFVFSNYFFGLGNNSNLIINKDTNFNITYLFGGLNFEHFQFSYSYDFNNLNRLNTGGAHELSLIYRFDLNKECYTCPKK